MKVVVLSAPAMKLRRAISGSLPRFGIEPDRFWLLADLFRELSQRREVLNQLGRDGATLKRVSLIYFILFGLVAIVMAAAGVRPSLFAATFLAITAFLLFNILLSEAGNSLVNPVEGLVLVHQPVNGPTYAAAKLLHLLRIVAYFTLGLNAAPALVGLLLPASPWWFPIAHLTATYLTGLTLALLACAIIGLLVRIFPPRRVKSAVQVADLLPMVLLLLLRLGAPARRYFAAVLPYAASPYFLGALAIIALFGTIFGIRSLSMDFLTNLTAIAQGASKGERIKSSWLGPLVSRFGGGPGARAAYDYAGKMMKRDWQFRRQLLALAPSLLPAMIGLFRGGYASPFAGPFTPAHLLPHITGFWLFFICLLMRNGAGYRSAWVFRLAPGGVFLPFAHGVWMLLATRLVALPHAILLAIGAWIWGPLEALLFTAFSLTLSLAYLALTMRVAECVPFTRQPDASRQGDQMAIMIAGGLFMVIITALQHFILFRSPAAVVAVTVLLAAAALWLTRFSLREFAQSMQFYSRVDTGEIGSVYQEIG